MGQGAAEALLGRGGIFAYILAAATAETDVSKSFLVYFAARERKITLSLDLLEQRFFFIFFVLKLFVGFVEVQFFLQLLCLSLVALTGLLG